MSDPQKPRDKLPDVTYQGVIIPGLNSWCQSSAIDTTTAMEDEAQLGPGKPTNRCKYENKPMPPTPTTSTSKISESSNTSTQTSSINPFFKWGSGFQSMKNRAVTDPIIPKPLFADKKDKPHLSSKKSFGSGPNDKLSEEEKTKERQLLAVLDNPYQAFHVFGASKKTHDEVPASAPPARSDLAPFSLSAMDQCSKRSFSPDRIIKSTPVPTRRYLRENNLPMPPLPKTSPTKSEPTNVVGEEEPPKIECFQGMILGDGKLNPTITGSYSRVGEVEYVENDHRQRIESQIGVIETVESLNLSNEQDCKDSNPATESGQNPGATYSPSIYGGIWENDPNVGYSLPPFSPNQGYHLQNPEQVRGRPDPLNASAHLGSQGFYRASNTWPVYPLPFPSDNLWMSNPQANSFVSCSPPGTAAPLPILNRNKNNAVPPPPVGSDPEYQPSAPMVTGLAQLELTLHHHMDSCFGSLSRLIIDKNDSTSDQMIRRFEALDDNVEQGIRDLNGSASGLKKDINSLINATKDVMRRLWVMQEHSRELELRLELLEKAARGGNTRYDSYASTTSVREPRTMSPQPSQSVHRRTGSAIEPSIRDESLNEGHPSVYGSRGFRSYTTSSAGPEVGEVRKVKKQLYTEPGAAKGPPPDLDDHTAVMEYEPPSTKNEDVRRMIEAGLNDPEGQIYSRGYRDGGWYESLYGKQKKENLEKP